MKRTLSFGLSALIAVAATGHGALTQSARAEDPYSAAGKQFYAKKDYKKALSYFAAASKTNPYDAENLYYQALTLQQLHDNKGAVKLYASLYSNFSYSQAGKLAGNALSRLDPEYYRQLTSKAGGGAVPRPAQTASTITRGTSSSGSSEGLSADYASLPSDVRIPYTKDGGSGLLVIDASVNNRSMKMFFDTGAEGCAFGKNHMREAGLSPPGGKSTGKSIGVGSSGEIETWDMPVTLKVGPIERRNFDIQIQDAMSTRPLLGQSFFKDYHYTIEKSSPDSDTSGAIHFVKKAAGGARTASSGRDPYAVPFTRSGKNLVVSVEVNGKSMQMFFDTGASNVAFTADQLKKANISIPEDATTQTTSGIGGETTSQSFSVSRIRMGPIEKSNFTVSCVGAASMPYPLLGQSFFGDWQYTIDNAASVIHFVRR